MPERQAALHEWAQVHLGLDNLALTTASADASFRRYFRLTATNGRSWIVMDAPPEKENSQPFVTVSAQLDRSGLQAPRVLHCDLQRGFLLLDDLGNETYLQRLESEPDSVDHLYGDAIAAIHKMQKIDTNGLPPYDETLLRAECALFSDWFLGRHLNLSLDSAEATALDNVIHVLIQSAVNQPQVFVHRDYHSRNLMVRAANNPGILDFQDAVYGPITYDLVSLLRDCYIAWPVERVSAWAKDYYSGLAEELRRDSATFEQEFDWMGVQRHLKAIGIFARLNHRDGKPGYLNDIPRVLEYVIAVSLKYPELSTLHQLCTERVRPLL